MDLIVSRGRVFDRSAQPRCRLTIARRCSSMMAIDPGRTRDRPVVSQTKTVGRIRQGFSTIEDVVGPDVRESGGIQYNPGLEGR